MPISGYADPSYGTETYAGGGLFFGSHGMPRVSAWISFTTNPGAAPVWVDVTNYLRAFSVKRGRQYELDQFAAGTATITLDNRDRRFDPTYTSSPYYPNVVPMRRIKLTATWGTDYTVFDGYVDGWPQSYDQPNEAKVDVTATDAFKVLDLAKLPASVYEYEIRADAPVHWWRLGEKQGTTAADSGSSPVSATLTGDLNFGTTGSSPYDANTAVGFVDPNASGGGFFSAPVSITSGDFTIEFWTDTTVEIGIPLLQGAPGNTNKMSGRDIFWEVSTDGVTVLDGSGNFVRQDAKANFVTTAGTLSSGNITSFAYAGWHHVVITRSGSTVTMYLDGVSRATRTDATVFPGGILLGPTDVYAAGLVVGLDEVAIYNSALSAARVLAHYNAATQAWAGDASDARVSRALNVAGFSSTARSIETGIATLGAAALNNGTVKTHIQDVELAEGGAFFFADDGTATFYNRRHLVTSPGNAVRATFGDGAGEQKYQDIVVAYDDTHIINEASITRAGGITQKATDATSQATYLVRSFERTDVHTQTDTDSLYAAQALVAAKKDAALRIESMTVLPQRDPNNLWPLVLDVDLIEKLTVKRRPQAIGSAISQDVVVEGIAHDVTPETWKTTYQLGAAPLSVWLLEDPVYGLLESTTRLSY